MWVNCGRHFRLRIVSRKNVGFLWRFSCTKSWISSKINILPRIFNRFSQTKSYACKSPGKSHLLIRHSDRVGAQELSGIGIVDWCRDGDDTEIVDLTGQGICRRLECDQIIIECEGA